MAQDAATRGSRLPHDVTLSATPFARLALAHALAAVGDAMVTVALAGSLFFDISPAAARSRVALSLLLTIAPFAVVAPLLGPAIDRRRGGRRLMVFAASAGRMVTCLVMAGALAQLLLFPLAFVALVLAKAHGVAKSALVPAAVESEDVLVEANAKLSLIAVLAGFVGAVPAVIVLRVAGGEWVLRLAAAVFAVAAVASLRIARSRHDRAFDAEAAAAEVRDPHVLSAATAMAALRGITGFLAFLIAFAFRRADAASWWFGLALAASMAGSLAGSVVAPRLRHRLREERILTGALVAVAVTGLGAARFAGRPAAIVLAAAVGLAAGAAKLAFDAIVQRDAPDVARGRSFARFEAGFQLAWVAAALPPVLLAIPERVGFFAIALAAGLSALVFVLAPSAAARDRSPARG